VCVSKSSRETVKLQSLVFVHLSRRSDFESLKVSGGIVTAKRHSCKLYTLKK
jgi:hypothetical protein